MRIIYVSGSALSTYWESRQFCRFFSEQIIHYAGHSLLYILPLGIMGQIIQFTCIINQIEQHFVA